MDRAPQAGRHWFLVRRRKDLLLILLGAAAASDRSWHGQKSVSAQAVATSETPARLDSH